MKNIIIIAALLLSVSASWAAGKVNIVSQTNGTVTATVSGTTITLTATPNEGYYITADNFKVEKTIDGSLAGARHRTPGITDYLTVTPTDENADPSGVTTYTVELPEGYDAEVSATFQQRTSIADATITLSESSLTFTGEELKPEVVNVMIGAELELSTDDYTVAYTDNINVGTATVTLTGARTYMGSASTTFTITKATATIGFEQEVYEANVGVEFASPKAVTNPADITVKYSSSDENIAAVDETTGEVTIKTVGEVVITATINDANYEAVSTTYQLNIGALGYMVKVNGQEVTILNKDNVLGDGDADKKIAPSVIYDPEKCTMVLTSAKDIEIESYRKDSLRIYLINYCYVKTITSKSETGKIVFTTNGSYPGYLKLKDEKGPVVSGFAEVKYESNLQLTAGALEADSADINVVLEPIVKKVTQVTPTDELANTEEELKKTMEPGEEATVKVIADNFLYTYTTGNDNGPDPTDNSYVINSPMTNEEVKNKIDNYDVNSDEYADNLTGITFRLPPGEYLIEIDAAYTGDMMLALYAKGGEPYALHLPVKNLIIKTNEVILVAIYGIQTAPSSKNGHRIGRKTTASAAVYSLSVTPQQINSSNSVDGAVSNYPTETLQNQGETSESDVKTTEETKVVGEGDPTGIEEKTICIDLTKGQEKLYDLQGRPVNAPKKAGIYISQGKKIIIK